MRGSPSPHVVDPRASPSHRSRVLSHSFDSKPASSSDCFTGQQHRRALLSQGKAIQLAHPKHETDTIMSSPKASDLIQFSHIETDSLPPVWLVPNEEGAIQRQAPSSPVDIKFGMNRFEIPDDETIVIPQEIHLVHLNHHANDAQAVSAKAIQLNSNEPSFANQCDSLACDEDFHKSIIHKTDSRFLEISQFDDHYQQKSPQELTKDSFKYRSNRSAKVIEMATIKHSHSEFAAISAATNVVPQTTSDYKNLSMKDDNNINNQNNTHNINTNSNYNFTNNKGVDSPNGIHASLRAKNKDRRGEYSQQQSMINSAKLKQSIPKQKLSGLDSVFQRLNLLRLTWKFIDSLRKNSRMLLYKRLKPHHFRVINDKSSFSNADDHTDESISIQGDMTPFQHNSKLPSSSPPSLMDTFTSRVNSHVRKRNLFTMLAENVLKPIQSLCQLSYAKTKKRVVHVINILPTLSPDNPVLLLWNIVLLISIVILLFFIPIQCAFTVVSYGDHVDNVGILLFAIDAVLKLNTGFFRDGEVVKQRSKIIIEHSKSWIWFNVGTIAIFSLEQSWRLLFVVNTITLNQLIESFDSYFQIKQRFYILYEIVKLVFLVCFIASTFGSIFYMISEIQVQNGEKNAWILTKPIHTWEDGYVYSLYFMFITMSTVGYGDLVPQNRYEVIYTAFITLMGSCVFAYCINSIGNLLSEISNRESFFKQRMNDVMVYLRTRNISRGLQVKVMRYLEYLQKIESSQCQLNSTDVLKYFSDNLKFELNKEFFGKLLRESKVFGLHFTPQFLSTLAQSMRETTLAPGDILYHKNQTDNRILFLTSGDIELFEKEVRLRSIESGEMLNYRGFFGNLPHSSSARSLSISHVSYCIFDDFVDLLKTFPQDYETFCFMRDEVNIYNRSIDSKCCSCQSFSHVFQECPLIHYRLNKDTVLRRWNYSEINPREAGYTRRANRGKSFLNLQTVKTKLKKYKVTLLTQMEDFSYLEGNDLTEDLTDKQFYKHLPSIKVSEDGFVYQESDLSNQTDLSNFSLDDKDANDNNNINNSRDKQQQQLHDTLTFDLVVPSEGNNNSSSPKTKQFQSTLNCFKNVFISPSTSGHHHPPSSDENNNHNNSNDNINNKGYFPQMSTDSFRVYQQQGSGAQQANRKILSSQQAQSQLNSEGNSQQSLMQFMTAKSLGRSTLPPPNKLSKTNSDSNGILPDFNALEQQYAVQQLQQHLPNQQQQQSQSQQRQEISQNNLLLLYQHVAQQLQSQTSLMSSSLPLFGGAAQQQSTGTFLPFINKPSRNNSQQETSEMKSNAGSKQVSGRPPSITYGPSKHLQRQHTGSSRAAQLASGKSAYTSQVSSTFKAIDKSAGFRTDSKDSVSQKQAPQQQQYQHAYRGNDDRYGEKRDMHSSPNNFHYNQNNNNNSYSNPIRLDQIRTNNGNNGTATNNQQIDNFLILSDFDILKEFSNYFPHNNSSHVIKQNQMLYVRNRRSKYIQDRSTKTNKLLTQQKTNRKANFEQSPFQRNSTIIYQKDKKP